MIDRLARANRFAGQVIDAMDELWTVLSYLGPFPDLNSEDLGAELLDFTLMVRWSESDSAPRVIDDYIQYSTEGDYVAAASISGISLLDQSFSRWLDEMRSLAKLAAAAERVLELLGSRLYEEQRCLVRVLV
jgi:PRTRC genetic system protein F